jgi:hypothetical protein
MTMNFKRLSILFFGLVISVATLAQTKTTEALHKKYSEGLSLFFYNNTLRMLNQKDDKAFDELIKDIEKMKFLMIEKKKDFNYKTLTAGYKSESYEEIMTSRMDGKRFDILLNEAKGKTKGVVVLVNDSTNLYVLDIVGSISLANATKLFSTIDESSDIGKQIKEFTKKDDKSKKEDKDDND